VLSERRPQDREAAFNSVRQIDHEAREGSPRQLVIGDANLHDGQSALRFSPKLEACAANAKRTEKGTKNFDKLKPFAKTAFIGGWRMPGMMNLTPLNASADTDIAAAMTTAIACRGALSREFVPPFEARGVEFT
jgi:hypothetical protein